VVRQQPPSTAREQKAGRAPVKGLLSSWSITMAGGFTKERERTLLLSD
jgi:hypothetical protein